jgi:tellurite resistance protein
MNSILEHPDDERFFIESVEPLIANVEQRGEYLIFLFRCPVSSFEATSKVRPGEEVSSALSPSLSGNPRLAGLLQSALRPGRERREGTDYTVDEIEEAACDAFELVSKEFYWDGSRWTHWEANDRVLNFLGYGEMLEDIDFEQRMVLRRVLCGVALADGKVDDSEQELLESLLGPGATAPGAAEKPTRDELKGLRTRSVAAAVVCLGYAIACVDGKLDESEEEYLSQICESVGLGTLKQWELKRTAQAFIVDEALAGTYSGGEASNEERLEIYKFGRGLGLSIPDLRELEWRFLKRTGIVSE